MKTIAIIQARMGSTRLPGKIMMDLAGKPDLERVLERVKLAKTVDEVWLATTDHKQDDVVAQWAKSKNQFVFRGSEEDVLDRFYQTAQLAKADVGVRITADCPLIDPTIIDSVVKKLIEEGTDYCSNVHPATFPQGLDIEVFTFSALEKAHKESQLKSEREHVTPYIWKHPEIFKLANVVHQPDLSVHRWTLDHPEDYEFLKRVFEELIKQNIFGSLEEVLAIVDEHPTWAQINQKHSRGEGYTKSLKEDGIFNAVD